MLNPVAETRKNGAKPQKQCIGSKLRIQFFAKKAIKRRNSFSENLITVLLTAFLGPVKHKVG